MSAIINRFRQQTKTKITRKFIMNRFPSSAFYSSTSNSFNSNSNSNSNQEHENSHSEGGIHFENHRIEDVYLVY